MIATVPATVLSSYFNDGAIPDPNYGDNQNAISDSFFYSDFWYRSEFTAPPAAAGRHVFLNFDGVNWKAEVFLNGQRLGRIDGGFITGRFDVTALLRAGQPNALAVRIFKNANPGSVTEKNFQSPGKNGGVLGADNPTMHASVGWDWIPTIRGRNTGIWGDVFLSSTGAVSIENPQADTISISTDGSSAEVALEATLVNHSGAAVSGKLRGRLRTFVPFITLGPDPSRPGAPFLTGHLGGEQPWAFEQAVTIAPNASKTVKLDPAAEPALRLHNPKLWWPNGYGDPNLYRVELEFAADGAVSDQQVIQRRRAPLHLQRGRRRAAHLRQRSPLRGARRQLGIPRIHAPLPRPRIRRRGALSPRHEFHHDPQLGGADRRRSFLRRLRPLRDRGLAGFLAGQPLGRAGSRR